MIFIVLGICLFVAFAFLFLLVMPRPSAAGALLQEVTRPMRVDAEVPAWRSALNVNYLAKPFTLVRSLFSSQPDPDLVRRLMLAGFRNPASISRRTRSGSGWEENRLRTKVNGFAR